MTSKMDRLLNTKSEKQSIYEIFRACRLCGAGGGYKMPIIQSIPLDIEEDVELRQKIRECVQIEVHQNDKMPPLICELCVDKINDFYEFLEMCRQTNKKTRLRLGLPPQTLPHGAPDAGDCILGVTEPVFINEDSGDVPLSKRKVKIKVEKTEKNKKAEAGPKLKRKLSPPPEEPKVILTRRSMKMEATRPTRQHTENSHSTKDTKSGRSLRETKTRIERIVRSPSPPPRRTTRQHHEDIKEDTMKLSCLKQDSKQATRQTRLSSGSSKDAPKSILKVKSEDTLLKPKELGKRTKEREQQKSVPVKKVKIAIKPVAPSPKQERRRPPTPPLTRRLQTAAAATATAPGASADAETDHKCKICGAGFVKPASLSTHMRSHSPSYTSSRLACNACREWFNTSEETVIHHRWHRISSTPYHCELCTADFRHHNAYNEHFDKKSCVPSTEVPDLKCESCWGKYPTQNLMDQHKCPGEDGRPGGKCYKCLRTYATAKTLRKHEELCRAKRREDVKVNPDVYATLRNAQIRFARCDPLLVYRGTDDGHYDISGVESTFGLDKKCEYPFFANTRMVRIKLEPDEFDGMVNIKDDLLDLDEAFVHWDSDDSCSSVEEVEETMSSNMVTNPFASKNKRPRVESLARLSIKTIFSPKCLGKVPKRKRKLKFENLKNESDFESLLHKSLGGEELNKAIVNSTDSRNEENFTADVPDKTQTEATFHKRQITDQLAEESTVDESKGDETSDSEKMETENIEESEKSDKTLLNSVVCGNKDDDKAVTGAEDVSNEDINLTKDLEKCNGIVVGISGENEDESEKLNESQENVDQADVRTSVDADSEECSTRRTEEKTKGNVEVASAHVDVTVFDDKQDKLSTDIDRRRLDVLEVNPNDVTSNGGRVSVEKTNETSVVPNTQDTSVVKMVDSNDIEPQRDVTDFKDFNKLHAKLLISDPETGKVIEGDVKLDANPLIGETGNVSEGENVKSHCERRTSGSVNGDVKGDLQEISDNELGDMSDGELDDSKLLEALDEQIDDIGSGKAEADEELRGNLDSSKGLEVYNVESCGEKDSQGSLRLNLEESKEDLEQDDKAEDDLAKNAQSTEISLEDLKDKPEESSGYSKVFFEENSVDSSNIRDREENLAVQNDTKKYYEINEMSRDKTDLLEDGASNSNSLDTPDKCLKFITHKREEYLLEEKTEDFSNRDDNDKINIEDIVTSRTDKSMDLDSISDEDFDFDT